MNKVFADVMWSEYLEWQNDNKKTLSKINELIKSIEREGVSGGIGKPERLKYMDEEMWSRRIDEKNRLVYNILNNKLMLYSCKGHYDDK